MLFCMLEGVSLFLEKQQADGPYAWELVASRRIKLIDVRTLGSGYTLMKPNEQYRWQGIPVDINQNGFRDDPVQYQKSAGTVRILNLGDSIAMGWGVAKEDTYGDVLERKITGKPAGSGKTEVINAAVPGWNQENALIFLQAEGLKYDPDLIIVDLTIPNDIYGVNALNNPRRHPVVEWFNQNTYTWPNMVVQYRVIQSRSLGNERIDILTVPEDVNYFFPLDQSSPVWDNSWNSIQRIYEIAKENDIAFVLLLFPLEFQVFDADYPTTAQQVFLERAKAADMPVIDLLPVFQAACREKPGGSCRLEDKYLFADLWMHPSRLGHQLAAQEVIHWIEAQQVLPAE